MVRPKKNLGQHFLTDKNIAKKIADTISYSGNIIEVGPGTGMLTKYFISNKDINFYAIETDIEAYNYLISEYKDEKDKIIKADFLKYDLTQLFNDEKFSVIGNYPYNISSQIFFKVLEYRNQINEVSGMIQKEVAERIVAKEGSKTYGILSVLLQAYFDISYLFTVHENVFNPPPKVKSAVIKLTRNNIEKLDCDEKLFFKIVKMSFGQRRKMLRSSLKSLLSNIDTSKHDIFTKRPEQLSVSDFIKLTKLIENNIK